MMKDFSFLPVWGVSFTMSIVLRYLIFGNIEPSFVIFALILTALIAFVIAKKWNNDA